jgi:predicted enzyme related to lactoylglutathione lyase
MIPSYKELSLQESIRHLTYHVKLDRVLAAGGRKLGDIVSVEIPGTGKITFVYLADPEGNIIELQKWAR